VFLKGEKVFHCVKKKLCTPECKMKGIGEGIVENVRMYDAIEFCVNWGCDEMTQVVVKETWYGRAVA
jgi:hypothetical protein